MPAVNDVAIDAIRFRFSALPRGETLVALVAAYLAACEQNADGG